jgi:hypothetical protein
MNSYFHTLITIDALGDKFSEDALNEVIKANLMQDSIIGQVFHNEYHYDNNKITLSNTYIKNQKLDCLQAISRSSIKSARKAFGRLIHTAQDFYAHSNYAKLYAKFSPSPDLHEPFFDCLFSEVLNDKDLRSHKVYFPIDHLSIFPFLAKKLRKFAPYDSHLRMNLDTPLSGALFVLVYRLAIKRTCAELNSIISAIDNENKSNINRFLGKVHLQ